MTTREPGDFRIRLGGELDLISSNRLWTMFCAFEAPDSLAVDLADVTFIDSMGVSTLVRMWRRAEAQGISLRLANADDHVRSVFEMVGLTDLLSVDQPV